MSTDACVAFTSESITREMVNHNYAFLLLSFMLCWMFVGIFACANMRREKALARVLEAVEANHEYIVLSSVSTPSSSPAVVELEQED